MTNIALIAAANNSNSVHAGLGAGFLMLLGLLTVWSLIWKGIALWKSAQNRNKVWFVIMLIVNTAGLLEILYIFIFSKRKKADSTSL